jgi:hypothetical protein
MNTISSLLYAFSAVQLLQGGKSPSARAYGLGNLFIAMGAIFFHATTTVVGFVADMVAIAASSTFLVSGAVCAIQKEIGCNSQGPTAVLMQLAIPMAAAVGALSIPIIMLVGGFSHADVWGTWGGLLALIVIVIVVVIAVLHIRRPVAIIVVTICWVVLYLLWMLALSGFPIPVTSLFSHHLAGVCSGLMLAGAYAAILSWAHRKWIGTWSAYVNLALALTCILLGLACTVHSFHPGLCTGVRQRFPLHAAWHFFSAITLNRAGHLLDILMAYAGPTNGTKQQ